MARSSTVWVVMGVASRLPVAAFTVKHELIRWLLARPSYHMLRLFRLGDGCSCDPRANDGCKIEVDIEYLLNNPTKAAKPVTRGRPQ